VGSAPAGSDTGGVGAGPSPSNSFRASRPPGRYRSEVGMRTRPWFLSIAGLLTAAAWLALWIWQQGPYGRYVDHGSWTEIGLGASICAALPAAGWALPVALYVGGWLLMTAAILMANRPKSSGGRSCTPSPYPGGQPGYPSDAPPRASLAVAGAVPASPCPPRGLHRGQRAAAGGEEKGGVCRLVAHLAGGRLGLWGSDMARAGGARARVGIFASLRERAGVLW
jgi:hypothetical protein